jgi:hypothetical protein
VDAGVDVTPIIDRFYFKSIFAVDEPAESLGESLSLPPNYRHLRDELEKTLTPLPDPRAESLSR